MMILVTTNESHPVLLRKVSLLIPPVVYTCIPMLTLCPEHIVIL